MIGFKDRIRKILNDGKNISVELPNDTFIRDLLVELEDNKSHHVSISESPTRSFSFIEEFHYHKIKVIDFSSSQIEPNYFNTTTNIGIKEVECKIKCRSKFLSLTPFGNDTGVAHEIIETIKDYLGDDIISLEYYPTKYGLITHIVYKSYEVYEREI